MKRVIIAAIAAAACSWACSTYSGLDFATELGPIGASGGSGAGGEGTESAGQGGMDDSAAGAGADRGGAGAGGAGGAPFVAEAGAPGGGADPGEELIPTGIAVAEATTNVVRTCSEPAVRFADRCPRGQVLIGFNGTLEAPGGAAYLRSLQGVCGRLSVSTAAPWLVTTEEAGTLPLRDLDLPQKQSVLCPEGEVVTAFSGRSGLWIDGLEIRCAPLEIVEIAGELEVTVGTSRSAGQLGAKSGGSAFASQECPNETVAVGQTGGTVLSGDVLGEVGVACAGVQLLSGPG